MKKIKKVVYSTPFLIIAIALLFSACSSNSSVVDQNSADMNNSDEYVGVENNSPLVDEDIVQEPVYTRPDMRMMTDKEKALHNIELSQKAQVIEVDEFDNITIFKFIYTDEDLVTNNSQLISR